MNRPAMIRRFAFSAAVICMWTAGGCFKPPAYSQPQSTASPKAPAKALYERAQDTVNYPFSLRQFRLNGVRAIAVSSAGLLEVEEYDWLFMLAEVRTVQLTPTQFEELKASANASLAAPGKSKEVTDYRDFRTLAGQSFDDSAPNPQFEQFDDCLLRLSLSLFQPAKN